MRRSASAVAPARSSTAASTAAKNCTWCSPDSRSSSPYGPPPSPVSTRTIGVVTQAAAAAPTMPMRSAIRIGTTNSRYVYGPWRSGEKIV